MKTVCPFCDSDNIEVIEIHENFLIPFCTGATIPHKTFRCNNCEEEGDFDNSLEKGLSKAINAANAASAPKLIDSLVRDGITMTYLEKALRLPFRTTSRWKRGRISHSSLALLRLIRFSPALLEVADENFSANAQAKYHFTQPCVFFEKHTTNQKYSLTMIDGAIEIGYQGEVTSYNFQSISPSRHALNWEQVK